MGKSDNKNSKNITIKLKNDDVASGSFANSFSITFTDQEFLLDFIMMQPQTDLGIITNRVVMTPNKIKDLSGALRNAIATFDNMNSKSGSDTVQ